MTRSRPSAVLAIALACALLRPAFAQQPPAAQTPAAQANLKIGYVELSEDPRYDEERAYARIQVRPLGRPFVGAEVAITESASISRVLRINYSLERFSGASPAEIVRTVREWAAGSDIHFVIADLPAAALADVAAALRDSPVLLLNATAPEDNLRGADCSANVAHTIPSYFMQADAMVQYLVVHKWTRILALQGPRPEDSAMVEALKRAAQRFGARVVETRPFELTNDPRQRDQSNVSLVTGNATYDVVYVADSDGEYSRYVPYRTQQPRPVVGSTGLVAEAWHWSWERNGGPQVNSRFEKRAGRRMTGYDWSAWVAVKALVQASLRTKSADFVTVRNYLLGDSMNLDGTKGNPLSFRAWDRQLRQPMFLTTFNAIIERAPLTGFLHQKNELDTLGVDQPETRCRS